MTRKKPVFFAARMSARVFAGLAGLLVIGVTAGCSTPKLPSIRRPISISVNDELSSGSVLVHVLVLPFDRAADFEKDSMTKYWNSTDSERDYMSRTVQHHFEPGRKTAFVIQRDDSIWNVWGNSGSDWLFVLADLPGSFKDEMGTADARRLILPLDPTRWHWNEEIRVKITAKKIITTTPPLPPQAQ